MNKRQLPRLQGHFVRLRPIARRTDGRVDLDKIDDDWRVVNVDRLNEVCQLLNLRTMHCPAVGFDQLHSYTSDPLRNVGAEKHGFLELNVQLTIGGRNGVDAEPLPRNGRRGLMPKP